MKKSNRRGQWPLNTIEAAIEHINSNYGVGRVIQITGNKYTVQKQYGQQTIPYRIEDGILYARGHQIALSKLVHRNPSSRDDFDRREAAELSNLLAEVDRQSLADRKDAAIQWQRDLQSPSLIAQRVHWLLIGNYGHGAMVKAIEMTKSRGNVAAQLGGLIAAVEWRVPNREARTAWNRLTQAQQVAVNTAIDEEVRDWRREQQDEGNVRHNPTPRIRSAKVSLAYGRIRNGRSQRERNQRLVDAQLMHRKMYDDYGEVQLPPLSQARSIIKGD